MTAILQPANAWPDSLSDLEKLKKIKHDILTGQHKQFKLPENVQLSETDQAIVDSAKVTASVPAVTVLDSDDVDGEAISVVDDGEPIQEEVVMENSNAADGQSIDGEALSEKAPSRHSRSRSPQRRSSADILRDSRNGRTSSVALERSNSSSSSNRLMRPPALERRPSMEARTNGKRRRSSPPPPIRLPQQHQNDRSRGRSREREPKRPHVSPSPESSRYSSSRSGPRSRDPSPPRTGAPLRSSLSSRIGEPSLRDRMQTSPEDNRRSSSSFAHGQRDTYQPPATSIPLSGRGRDTYVPNYDTPRSADPPGRRDERPSLMDRLQRSGEHNNSKRDEPGLLDRLGDRAGRNGTVIEDRRPPVPRNITPPPSSANSQDLLARLSPAKSTTDRYVPGQANSRQEDKPPLLPKEAVQDNKPPRKDASRPDHTATAPLDRRSSNPVINVDDLDGLPIGAPPAIQQATPVLPAATLNVTPASTPSVYVRPSKVSTPASSAAPLSSKPVTPQPSPARQGPPIAPPGIAPLPSSPIKDHLPPPVAREALPTARDPLPAAREPLPPARDPLPPRQDGYQGLPPPRDALRPPHIPYESGTYPPASPSGWYNPPGSAGMPRPYEHQYPPHPDRFVQHIFLLN